VLYCRCALHKGKLIKKSDLALKSVYIDVFVIPSYSKTSEKLSLPCRYTVRLASCTPTSLETCQDTEW